MPVRSDLQMGLDTRQQRYARVLAFYEGELRGLRFREAELAALCDDLQQLGDDRAEELRAYAAAPMGQLSGCPQFGCDYCDCYRSYQDTSSFSGGRCLPWNSVWEYYTNADQWDRARHNFHPRVVQTQGAIQTLQQFWELKIRSLDRKARRKLKSCFSRYSHTTKHWPGSSAP